MKMRGENKLILSKEEMMRALKIYLDEGLLSLAQRHHTTVTDIRVYHGHRGEKFEITINGAFAESKGVDGGRQ